MAIVVRIVDQGDGCWQTVNRVAHITIGTRNDSIKPKESNDMLAKWIDSGDEAGSRVHSIAIDNRKIIEGKVHGVLSR